MASSPVPADFPFSDSSALKDHALFLDVDGTLIDIAPHPDAVTVPQGLVEVLGQLAQGLDGALALVSGRTLDRLDQLFTPLRLPGAGIHGGELRLEAGGPVVSQVAPMPEALRQGLNAIAMQFPGAFVEDKETALAIHYRAAPQAGPALGAAIGEMVGSRGAGFAILPGHMVFEVKPVGHDKGTAVARFLQKPEFAGRRPIFVGDDVTDEAGFRAARAHGGLAVSVGRALADVDAVVEDAARVRAWLAGLVPVAVAGR